MDGCGRPASHQSQDCGQKIDCAGLRPDVDAGWNPGTRQQEDDPQRGIVEKNSVRILAMLAEALAVIRKHGDQCVAGRFLTDGVEQTAELMVGICNLAIVEAIFVLFPEGRRRLVRGVRIVDMHPQEIGLAGLRVQPAHGMVHRFARAAFGIFVEFMSFAGLGHLVVVDREALVEPEELLQNRRTDERRGIPALLLKNSRQRCR